MAKAFKHNKDGRVSEDAGFPADAKTSKAAAVVIFVFSFAVLLDLLDKVKALFF